MKVPHSDSHVNGRANGNCHKPAGENARPHRTSGSKTDLENGKPRRRLSRRKQPDIGTFHVRGEADDAAEEFVGSMYQPDYRNPQEGIFVLVWAMQITRTKAELLVLSQFAYWFGVSKNPKTKGKARATIVKDGYSWVYKTFNQLAR